MLLVFWTLAFMQVNFRLIVVTKEKWYNNVTSPQQLKVSRVLREPRHVDLLAVQGLTRCREDATFRSAKDCARLSAEKRQTKRSDVSLLPFAK